MTIGELLDKTEARCRDEGREEGREEGRAEGENRLLALIDAMEKDGESEQIRKLSKDAAFLEEMYKKYDL